MRAGQQPDATPANKKAWEDGFARMLKLMSESAGGKKMSRVLTKRPTVVAKAAVQCHDMAGME
jgi:hypothetical protein